MNEKTKNMFLVCILVAVAIIIGGVIYLTKTPKDDTVAVVEEVITKDDKVMAKEDMEVMMEKSDSAVMKYEGAKIAGNKALLLEFNKKDYDAAVSSGKLVTLYFYANWCPVCKAEFPIMMSVFNSLTDENVIGFRVNYKDSDTSADEKDLAKEFGVPYQHTKVFVKNGRQLLKAPDGWDKARYESEIAKYAK